MQLVGWIYEGGPPKTEFIYKKLCIYSYTFKLQSPSKYSPFDTIYLWRHFFYFSKQFLNSSMLMPFSASAIFCFTFSTSATHFSLRTFFIRQTKKKSLSQWDGVNRRGGAWASCICGQKLLNTQHRVGRYACKSPIMKWANTLKVSSKKFTEAKCSLSPQCQLVHWYRWVPRTLAQKGNPVLQGARAPKDNSCFMGVPPHKPKQSGFRVCTLSINFTSLKQEQDNIKKEYLENPKIKQKSS